MEVQMFSPKVWRRGQSARFQRRDVDHDKTKYLLKTKRNTNAVRDQEILHSAPVLYTWREMPMFLQPIWVFLDYHWLFISQQ